MLLTYLNCEDCQKNLEFQDEINKNNTNFSKEECDNYELSFIKKNIDNVFEYTVLFTCKKCKSKINKTFREKEAYFNFKCEKCPLKGMNLNYFLSQENDAYQKNDSNNASNPKENNILQPLNSISDLTPAIYGKKPNNSIDTHSNLEFDPHKNDINNNINNPKNSPQIKIYTTPNDEAKKIMKEKEQKDEKKIKVIFVKDDKEYSLEFFPSDIINNKINYIKQKIDLGSNPVFIYNSNELDKNKSFTENKIYNEFKIEIKNE